MSSEHNGSTFESRAGMQLALAKCQTVQQVQQVLEHITSETEIVSIHSLKEKLTLEKKS